MVERPDDTTPKRDETPAPLARLNKVMTVDVSCELEIYPAVPRPATVERSWVLEMYPAVPKFRTVDVSWAEEMYPAVPRFRTVEYSWSPVTPAADVLV